MSLADRPPVSLYLHVPFCVSKCDYCDFTSAPVADQPLPEEGVMWAIRERAGQNATLADAFAVAVPLYLAEFAERGVLARVPSVYIGGGTPTVLGDRLVGLVEQTLALCGLERDAEVCVEANPDTVTATLAEALVAAGVNRFSLGVQSFDDDVLATLGRCHDASSARRAVDVLGSTGARVSIDLICGVPGQTLDSWRATVATAIETGVGHVSVYPLSLEEGTPLAARVEAGRLDEPDPDAAAEMMLLAERMLPEAGLSRYEVASYAREGERAAHNTGYWTGRPYLGVGPAAASMLPIPLALLTPMDHYVRTWPESWNARFVVNDTLESFLGYLWDRQPASLLPVTDDESAREAAMLGLRLSDGITEAVAERAGAREALERLQAQGLIEHADGCWRTTTRGWLLGNEVFEAVWDPS